MKLTTFIAPCCSFMHDTKQGTQYILQCVPRVVIAIDPSCFNHKRSKCSVNDGSRVPRLQEICGESFADVVCTSVPFCYPRPKYTSLPGVVAFGSRWYYGLQSSFRSLQWEGLPNRWLCATVVEVETLFWGSSSRRCKFGVASSDCGESTVVLSRHSSSSSDSGCTQFGCGRDISYEHKK